jgi:hypothetical protein
MDKTVIAIIMQKGRLVASKKAKEGFFTAFELEIVAN